MMHNNCNLPFAIHPLALKSHSDAYFHQRPSWMRRNYYEESIEALSSNEKNGTNLIFCCTMVNIYVRFFHKHNISKSIANDVDVMKNAVK